MDWLRNRSLQLVAVFGLLLFVLTLAETSLAETTLVKNDLFEVFTDGRAGGFLSWVYGDGKPQTTYAVGTNAAGEPVVAPLWNIVGGEVDAMDEQVPSTDPALAAAGVTGQGTVNSMRLRSGFIGNSLGFGVRTHITDTTTAMAYLQFWTFIESPNRNKGNPNPADLKLGYAEVQGPFGTITAGRTRSLFSRGATDINFKYAYAYAVGFPAELDSNGPSRGMIGFGVMGTGWGGALMYATPNLGGFQATVGVYDPIQNQAANFKRTKYPRPEAELKYKLEFGNKGLFEPFVNGTYQKLYRDGYCDPNATPAPGSDPRMDKSGHCEMAALGVGYGARFEYSFFHLGLSGHFGDGLGLTRALEVSSASTDLTDRLRSFDGYYAQTQFVLGNFDLFAGAGLVRIFLNDDDKRRKAHPFNEGETIPEYSLIKNQIGMNAGAVFHWTEHLHFALDYFRAELNWYLGEKQVLNAFNGGMTFTW